ncbi:MAG TPA: pilus assembly protein PilP [Syntrophorhabdaceae bacterium]|nr:pilus assembly protein PilP [Syntrophorhabdaceae bacterium]
MLILIIFLIICPVSFSAEPKPQPKPEQRQLGSPPKFNIGDFTYSATNRRDPFESIFYTKVQKSIHAYKSDKTLKKGYELEELKLVGILRAVNTKIAMMEDMQGRGILFRKGDYLNKNLWIVEILDANIILGYKLKGEIRTFTLDIPRKKEGM